MTQKEAIVLIVIVAAAAVAVAWIVAPAIGLTVAMARGLVPVSPRLATITMIVVTTGGGVAAAGGAVAAASKIKKYLGTIFLLACAFGEWIIADTIADLYLEKPIGGTDKNILKGCMACIFWLAGHLWKVKGWKARVGAVVLFLVPSSLLGWKAYVGEVYMTSHGVQLYLLIGAPIALAALYIVLSANDLLRDE